MHSCTSRGCQHMNEGHTHQKRDVPVVIAMAIPGGMLMFSVINLVKYEANGVYSTSLTVYNATEAVLLTASIAALCVLYKSPKVSSESQDAKNSCAKDDYSPGRCPNAPAWCMAAFSVLALLAAIGPVFKAVAAGVCLALNSNIAAIVNLCLDVVKATFVFLQMVCLVRVHRVKYRTQCARASVLVLVSVNACLCVSCVSDAARQTMTNTVHNNSMAVFKVCDTQPRVLTNCLEVSDEYLYAVTFLVNLFSIQLLCGIWNLFSSSDQTYTKILNTGKLDVSKQIEENVPDAEVNVTNEDDTQPGFTRVRSKYRTFVRLKLVCFKGLFKYSFIPTGIWCIGFLIAQIYLSVGAKVNPHHFHVNRTNTTAISKEELFLMIEAVYVNFISGAAFVGILLIRKETICRDNINTASVLLAFCTCQYFMLTSLGMFDALANMQHKPPFAVILLVLTIFHCIGLICQAVFIIKLSTLYRLKCGANKLVCVHGIILFLAICNAERSLSEVLVVPMMISHLHVSSNSFLGRANWILITRVLLPGVVFFRVQSTLMSLQNRHRGVTCREASKKS